MTYAHGAATRPQPAAPRYELGAPFATGGMGVIRRGYDRWAGREVAHKRLRIDREDRRPRISALFQREYDTLARLKHPNIVEVFDYGFDAQGAYYAMEWLAGDDLSKRSPLPYRETCAVLRDVASALALLHTRRFVHRDVSPNNVRLTSTGVAKLIDFGALTYFGRPTEIAGTPAFIAPECVQDEELDQRTDIYGLGALAYWTLTGRAAVRAQSIAQLPEAFSTPVTPLAHQVPDIPEALHELVHAMMSHDRAQRPASAGEVVERLTAIGGLAPEPDERRIAFSYLKHPPLVGRSEALAELRGALDDALQGRGSVLAIEGGIGLGRSALIDQLSIDAQLRGALVLRAEGGAESGAHGVARRLIQLGLRIYPDLEGSDAFMRRMVDGQVGSEGSLSAMELLERTSMVSARLRRWLIALCQRSPLVIAIDDADLADEESLGLLASMMREEELAHHPLLLTLVTHGVQSSNCLPLDRLRSGARRVLLSNVEEGEVVDLLTGVFGDVPNAHRTALWLYRETGGNPAQCIDLLRLLIQEGSVRYQRGTFSFPHDIDNGIARERRADALLTRVSGLAPDALALIELLSLHHGSLTVPQLCDASALTPSEVGLAIEKLVHRGLVFAPDSAVSLRGESLRTVIGRTLGPEHTQALHMALARAIEQHPGEPLSSQLALAHHLFRAGVECEPEAAELVMKLLAEQGHDVSFFTQSIPLLETTLAYYRTRPACEPECADLLAALAVSGFFGNLDAQRTHLRPAMAALTRQCGFDVARKLKPWLGVTLGFVIGILWAWLFAPLFRRRFGRHSLRRRLSDLFAVAGSGIAAAATTADDELVAEIVGQLEPTNAIPTDTAPGLAREFCLASSELSQYRLRSAAQRYERAMRGTARPRMLFDEQLRKQLHLGCVNGLAHARLDWHDGGSLRLAEELELGSPFFASHAEIIRLIYWASAGEQVKAESHRMRAETLALRGGASWTAASLLARRLLEPAVACGDVPTLVRVEAELERLAPWAPTLARYSLATRARLCLLRGQAEQAVTMLEPALTQTGSAQALRLLRITMAEALIQLGSFERARELARLADADIPREQREYSSTLRGSFVQLARAELGLGNHEAARAVIREGLEYAAQRNNPLELGVLHRELASIELAVRDGAEFDRHLSLMSAHFRATQHPNLARQRELLLARAAAAGLKESPTGSFYPDGDGEDVSSDTFVEPRTARRAASRRE